MDLSKIEKNPEIGDYVFCSRWADRRPDHPWEIGILEDLPWYGEIRFTLCDSEMVYKNCQVISPLQGILILGLYPQLQISDVGMWMR